MTLYSDLIISFTIRLLIYSNYIIRVWGKCSACLKTVLCIVLQHTGRHISIIQWEPENCGIGRRHEINYEVLLTILQSNKFYSWLTKSLIQWNGDVLTAQYAVMLHVHLTILLHNMLWSYMFIELFYCTICCDVTCSLSYFTA